MRNTDRTPGTAPPPPPVAGNDFFLKAHWQSAMAFAMLCVSCLYATAVAAQSAPAKGSPAKDLRLQEAQVARQAAEEHAAELDVELKRTRKDLERLRERYADLYLKSQEAVRRERDLDLRAAHLLLEKDTIESGKVTTDLLNALAASRKAQSELLVAVRGFQTYLKSVFDVLQPSDALRREVTERSEALVDAAERALKPLSIVAGRGNRDFEGRSCRVLAVNDDLQIIVLDSGFAAGIRRGTNWKYVSDNQVVARLRVIEVRPEISAAVVTEGRLNAIGPGGVVTPE